MQRRKSGYTGAARQEERRKTLEEVHGCSEGGVTKEDAGIRGDGRR